MKDLRDRPAMQDKRLGGRRVCVLRGREAKLTMESWRSCTDGTHRHISAAVAQELVDLGQMEYVRREGAGKKFFRGEQKAVRIVGGRIWRKTISRDGYGSTAVMQWVPGG